LLSCVFCARYPTFKLLFFEIVPLSFVAGLISEFSKPNNNLISVVFPAPLTPIIPILSFSSTEKDISLH